MQRSAELTEGAGTAVTAESLYLVNLLLAPGLGFLLLVWMWWRSRDQAPPLAASHLSQTISGSIWAGILLVVANALILLLGGYRGPHVWVVVITYFTFCHSMLVMFGAYGLSKAMAGQCWRYPLIGRPLPAGCGEG
ncbi:MAG: hypothetical protein KDI22_12245 [Gammaproteobacteria bacterium]|mgnify:FL=1|nr:hypothetical protein [Gammaproteobacteria bacterium]MCB1818177.1 hypothetical protein [Gammaproteobacteria bacterium]MCP5319175.1 hypothetical protein [Chromatiaceae bacterium]